MHDSKLDMRMNKEDTFSAYDVVNRYAEKKLSFLFFEYGEERYAKIIARTICENRKVKPIETTFELVACIKQAIPHRATLEKQHPAKRVFQAIRIEVNGELKRLENTIKDSVMLLNNKGRLAIITFHSLEDRIVKHTFEELEGKCTCPNDFPVCICGFCSYGSVITHKPIMATEQELADNPRARSAKLRIFEKR